MKGRGTGSLQLLNRRTGQKNIAGESIRASRLELGWTMEQLSNHIEKKTGLDLSIATIDKIEKGKRSVYDYEVVAFALVLGRSLEELLAGVWIS